MAKFKIKKGDTVTVITGKDKGKIGKVLKMIPSSSRVLVSGINLAKVHLKPSQLSDGGIVAKELSIHVSNLAHVDPKLGSSTKVGYKIVDGKKTRFYKKSGELFVVEGGK